MTFPNPVPPPLSQCSFFLQWWHAPRFEKVTSGACVVFASLVVVSTFPTRRRRRFSGFHHVTPAPSRTRRGARPSPRNVQKISLILHSAHLPVRHRSCVCTSTQQNSPLSSPPLQHALLSIAPRSGPSPPPGSRRSLHGSPSSHPGHVQRRCARALVCLFNCSRTFCRFREHFRPRQHQYERIPRYSSIKLTNDSHCSHHQPPHHTHLIEATHTHWLRNTSTVAPAHRQVVYR